MTDIDKGFEKIKKELQEMTKLRLVIYIDEALTYSNGGKKGEKVEYIAMLMEYGSEEFNVHYPSRPFFRSAYDANYEKLMLLVERNINLIIQGKMTANAFYQNIGRFLTQKIKDMIYEGTFQELSEITIKRKRKKGNKYPEKPLIDEGILAKSIRYKVELV